MLSPRAQPKNSALNRNCSRHSQVWPNIKIKKESNIFKHTQFEICVILIIKILNRNSFHNTSFVTYWSPPSSLWYVISISIITVPQAERADDTSRGQTPPYDPSSRQCFGKTPSVVKGLLLLICTHSWQTWGWGGERRGACEPGLVMLKAGNLPTVLFL